MKVLHFAVPLLAALCGWYAAQLAHPPAIIGRSAARKILFYQSPMHPWVKSNKPGQCTVCGMDLVPVYEGESGKVRIGSAFVILQPGTEKAAGVQTAVVEKAPLARTLRVAGTIGEDESRHGVISAPVEGRIDGLAMNCDGVPIGRRQPLVTIFSRTLLSDAKDYKLALGQGGAALETAKQRLEQDGLVWEQISAIPTRQDDDIHFGLVSPLGGVIVKSYVNEGQYVFEGDKLFEIADFTRMWFIFVAYEQDLPFLRTGQTVLVHTPSLPTETLKAKIGFIDPNLDPMTRSARIRVVLENPDRRIKDNAYAEAVVETNAPDLLTIPRSAVLWPGETPRVFVQKAPGAYERRGVKLGREGDSAWEVLEGLNEGERVVTSGNMLIDGQAQLSDLAETTAAEVKP